MFRIIKNGMLLAAAGAGAGLALRSLLRARRHYDFQDKVVWITGGSRGLGLVLARELARHGARLAICARDIDELQHAEADLETRGAQVLAIPCDITDRHQVDETVQLIRQRWGPVDVLINNAGVIQVGPMEVMTLEDYEESLKVHFWGPLYTILAVLPEMRQQGEGRIVNISSIGGKLSAPHLLPYCAGKFALSGLSEGLRAELTKDGIFVTTVCPGMMRTGSPRNAQFKGQHRAEYTWFSISDSLPLLSISAEEAASQIVAACQRGDAELVLTLPARLAVRVHGVLPGLTAEVQSLVNGLLPGVGGIGTQRARGTESHSRWAPSWLTRLTEKAAVRNNEVVSRFGPGLSAQK